MLPVSNDTLLRVVRRRGCPPFAAPSVIGIDDWAWRRNQRYGTIICDLERRRPITLLPDREPATAQAWLAGQPQIAVVARDRGGGYRRLHVLLKREGYVINHKKLFRLYREEKLAVRRRGGRKRAIGTRAPMTVPVAPNDRWSLDFVSDQLTDGRRFRILTVVDDCKRRDSDLNV